VFGDQPDVEQLEAELLDPGQELADGVVAAPNPCGAETRAEL